MKIILVGYGRLGMQAVKLLAGQNHSLVVIDKDRNAAEKSISEDAGIRVLVGDAVDPDLLREAGAEKADVLLALTRQENTNLMAAQIARIVFNVPKTIAVVYDPQREKSFQAAGIDTLKITVTGAEILASKIVALSPSPREVSTASHAPPSPSKPLSIPVPERSAAGAGPYYVIIVGGGKVGYYLCRTLLDEGHETTIIEADPRTFDIVSDQLDCPVIQGDGSTYAVLEKAGTSRCDVFVAVTNHDSDNLIACEVAKREFGVAKTIARVKNPKNERIMQQLGVDVTVSSTALISSLIESEMPIHKIRTLLSLRAGHLEIMEYVLDDQSPVISHQIKDVTMPSNCNIVTIIRRGNPLVPRGDTAFETSDVVLVLTELATEPQLRKLLLG